MGLTLRYRGRLHSPCLIPALTAEVRDICESNRTPYRIWKDVRMLYAEDRGAFARINGITYQPDGCDTVSLLFTETGELLSWHRVAFGAPLSRDLLRQGVYVNMLYGDADRHIELCGLLKYLSEKFFAAFRVDDETRYWQTDDEIALRTAYEDRRFTTGILTQFASQSENTDVPDAAQTAAKLVGMVRRMRGEGGV